MCKVTQRLHLRQQTHPLWKDGGGGWATALQGTQELGPPIQNFSCTYPPDYSKHHGGKELGFNSLLAYGDSKPWIYFPEEHFN